MPEHDLRATAFPTLSEDQLAAMGECSLTSSKTHRDGEKLFQAGDRDFRFFVIRSGQIEIVDDSGDPPQTIALLGPGQFTGEVTQLTGTPSLTSGVARGDCAVYELSRDSVRQLINLHPRIGDVLLNAFLARRQLLQETESYTGIRVIGPRDSQDTFRIREFLGKNRLPFQWLDLDSDPHVDRLLEHFGVKESDTPVVAWGRKLLLRNPSNRELAEALGLRRAPERTTYDLTIVGAGPAGLAAAVYGASEGLKTIVLESLAPGGQAGYSMRIENFLGFPTGISGAELAERAVIQANKFGARLPIATVATGLRFQNSHPEVMLDGGETVRTRCVLIATGADYRHLEVEGCRHFEGRGVYYAATFIEAQMCSGADVVIVGGGNSAGQAAVFLAPEVRKVHLVVRADRLDEDMSQYLVDRIQQTPNIEVLLDSEVTCMSGDERLREVEILNRKKGKKSKLKASAAFSFIGVVPRTNWLPAEIERDAKGFVLTGVALTSSANWKGGRQPRLLETSHPGVFAAGDVRAGSVKRFASAVGEGAMAVPFVHEFLREA